MHSELRALAGMVFADQDGPHLLQPTALVSEVWIKLAGKVDHVENKAHFFALAARAMRQVLADYARSAGRQKRGGNAMRISFSEERFVSDQPAFDLVDFNEALEDLARLNQRHAHIAEYRLLGAMSVDEIADVIGVHARTVKRDWRIARLWLQDRLTPDGR
ncbi:MAG: sigma-70 family RNA polymerase sigma factor [Phycisphaerales bacterium]